MRKVVLILLVLLMAAPAMAAITISAVQPNPGDPVQINYVCTGVHASSSAKALIAGMAFDVSVDNGCLITTIGGHKEDGESTSGSPGYGVYMKEAQIDMGDPCNPTWVIGGIDPVADPCDSDSPGQLGGNIITIQFGALFADPCDNLENAPLDSGTLCVLTVDDPCEVGSYTMCIALDDTRGGIVMTDQSTPDPCDVTAGCFELSSAVICFRVGQVWGLNDAYELTVTQDMVDRWDGTTQTSDGQGGWINLASPDCWCNECHVCGDSDDPLTAGAGFVTYIPDVKIVIDNWSGYAACADYNMDGFITYIPDVKTILDHWASGCDGLSPNGCVKTP